MTSLTVSEGTQVTLHFALKLTSGEVIDSTFEGDPAQFILGDGNFLEGFEKKLLGLKAGARETFLINPENGFGQANPNNIQKIPRDQFAEEISLETGLVLSFADAQNNELPGIVTDFDDEAVTVDFNHPLAGYDIEFEVEILSVDPLVKH